MSPRIPLRISALLLATGVEALRVELARPPHAYALAPAQLRRCAAARCCDAMPSDDDAAMDAMPSDDDAAMDAMPSDDDAAMDAMPSDDDTTTDVAPPSATVDNTALKTAFRLAAARAERGFRLSSSTLADLQAQVGALEACNPTPAPVDSPLLVGSWELEFCDAADVLSFGASPFEIGFIQQNILEPTAPDTLEAENVIEILPPLSSLAAASGLPLPRAASQYCIGATCKRLSETRVGLVFARVRLSPYGLPEGLKLEGGLPQPAVEALQRLTEGMVYLETTYLDDDLRVARGPGREIYVLSRNVDAA